MWFYSFLNLLKGCLYVPTSRAVGGGLGYFQHTAHLSLWAELLCQSWSWADSKLFDIAADGAGPVLFALWEWQGWSCPSQDELTW